jgi:hypothetical protein
MIENSQVFRIATSRRYRRVDGKTAARSHAGFIE